MKHGRESAQKVKVLNANIFFLYIKVFYITSDALFHSSAIQITILYRTKEFLLSIRSQKHPVEKRKRNTQREKYLEVRGQSSPSGF